MKTWQRLEGIDRSKYAAVTGPWDDEPDKIEWNDEATGLPCIVLRHPTNGHLCGYVAVMPGHPLHGKESAWLGDVKPSGPVVNDIEVHGGVTYADACHGNVCHKPAPGEPDDVWWLGFDMAHSGDLAPMDLVYGYGLGSEYRTVDYVRGECTRVATQLAAMK